MKSTTRDWSNGFGVFLVLVGVVLLALRTRALLFGEPEFRPGAHVDGLLSIASSTSLVIGVLLLSTDASLVRRRAGVIAIVVAVACLVARIAREYLRAAG